MNMTLHDAADYAEAAATADAFAFSGPYGTIRADGRARRIGGDQAVPLDIRLEQAFQETGPGAMIAGALPFSHGDQDCLWMARRCRLDPPGLASDPVPIRAADLRAEPSTDGYAAAVEGALRIMRDEAGDPDGLRKVVLARTLAVEAPAPIAQQALMARLADDPAVTAFRVKLPQQGRALIGATPELLLEKCGTRVRSYPLAGSARRSTDPVIDGDACAALARSEKDRREHSLVVEFILDTLTPWCDQLSTPEGTGLTSTRSMWHLGTRIEGRLRDFEVPSAVLASALHPTPAVCGLPCARAATLIDKLEPVARGFYAGAVGWCDRDGDGAWFVAIRCADICGSHARLYAGAGIVPGSDPADEAAETGSKFAALLRALGLPADAALRA